MKHVAILCGGRSYEHEVSVITGLQVAEAIDSKKYTFSFVYFDKHNQAWLIPTLKTRKDFKKKRRIKVDIVKREDGTYLQSAGWLPVKRKINVFYLAFHGGSGESGPVQGLLEVMDAAHTSPTQEGSVLAMNKSVTKEILRAKNLPTLDSVTVFTADYERDKTAVLKKITKDLEMPVIIKPVHLGSSIAIEVAHDELELEKHLTVALRVDKEVLIEPALQDFTEFNVSVRSNGVDLELSPIEEPKREGEVLSFADKYDNGSKKTGGNQGGGMELLDRTVPAKISDSLAAEINELAKQIYKAVRLDGLVRIDFMYSEGNLYCTEVNPIPGSMSFYLWEAAGEQFSEQITQAIEDASQRNSKKVNIVPYQTDIVDKFVS